MDFTEPYRTDPVCFMYKKPPPAPQVILQPVTSTLLGVTGGQITPLCQFLKDIYFAKIRLESNFLTF